jgi:hypothetical protein
MKNKLLYLAIFLGSVFAMTSCEDFLTTKSLSNDDLEYLCSNPTDTRKMVDRIYSYFTEDSYTSRMSNNWMQNTDVEIGPVNKAQSVENTRRGIWAINTRDFGDILTAWNHNYNAIDFANQVIEGIEGSEMYKNGNVDMQQLLGETYCLRAYRYFLLVNFWGDVPFATTPSKYDTENNTPRVDKNIIYSHLIQDLVNVEGTMMWAERVQDGAERMNREFAIGFIARLALFRAGYSMQEDGTMSRCRIDDQIDPVTYTDENGVEKTAQTSDDFYQVAQAYCRKLIKLKDRALPADFKNIFDTQINSANKPNGDVLFEMGFIQNGGGDVGWCIGIPVTGGSKGTTTMYTFMAPAYATSFDKEDQRLNVTCAPISYMSEGVQNAKGAFAIAPGKWNRLDMATFSDGKNTGINWPVLRYPDVLLMLAEANNEINHGPDAEAKQMLARVRERAFVNAENKTEKVVNYINQRSSYETFKKAIIDERAWEFGGECVRKFDLIRWNYYSDAIVNSIEWMLKVTINAQQLNPADGVYDKNKPIADLNVAERLYFKIKNGMVEWENDMFTARDASVEPYKSATTIADGDIKAGYTSDNLYRVDFAKAFSSVSDTDPTTKLPYGTNESGDAIKKGVINENVFYSYFGLTESALTDGAFAISGLEGLRSKPTPYVMPIPSSKVSISFGVLSNQGYGIRNK